MDNKQKKIIAVNTSPRTKWNTAQLVKKAASGAENAGAHVEYYDLCKAEPFTGCKSCFGCKRSESRGKCVLKDGLTEILCQIGEADGLIIGSPVYLGCLSYGFQALYERLCFQLTTYRKEISSYNTRKIPVILIVTSNVHDDSYEKIGYLAMLEKYRRFLERHLGPVQLLISGDTLQVDDYSKYDWTVFDPVHKKERHEQVFPQHLEKAYLMGKAIVSE